MFFTKGDVCEAAESVSRAFARKQSKVRLANASGRNTKFEGSRIDSNLKRMGDLLRQVRLIPGANADPGDLGFDLSAETTAIVDDFRFDPDAKRKGIDIQQTIDSNGRVDGHISRLAYYRILDNLMRNAIEAVSSGRGKISVHLKSQNFQPTLVVQDNGCGIAPDIKDSIFKSGFTTKQSRGTGLGLGILTKLCKEFGATVSVESSTGKGTAFTVVFQRPLSNRSTEITESVALEHKPLFGR